MQLFASLLMGILLVAAPAAADIYRHVDDDGVVCFTDTPTGGNASVFMKDPARQRGTNRKVSRAMTTPRKETPHLPEASQAPPSASSFPVQGRISSPVGLRHDPIDGSLRHHQGVDIAVASGTPVRPVAAGVVVFSGTRLGYGKTVTIQHGDGMTTLYAHHSVNIIAEGAMVDEETVIALSGSTGRSTGPHLHFEAWKEGNNITASYLASRYGLAGAGELVVDDGIRRIVQADGSLLFTNLPRIRP